MKITKTIIIITSVFFFTKINAQEKFKDYCIKIEGDTIYGLIKQNGPLGKGLFTRNLNPSKNGVKFYYNNLKNVSKISWNDKLYEFIKPSINDGIYQANEVKKQDGFIISNFGNFYSSTPILEDYVIYENNTIYGKIIKPLFGKLYLKSNQGEKHKIKNDKIKEYRFRNEVFVSKKRNKFTSKKGFYRLLIRGKLSLLEYKVEIRNHEQNLNITSRTEFKKYVIEYQNELIELTNINFKRVLKNILANDKAMIEKITDEEYNIENLFHLVNYINSK
jgi:hypothetical protein